MGSVEFETLPDSFRATMAFKDERYQWSAFQDIRESDHSLFLMLGTNEGVILPKRAFADNLGVLEFKALVQHKIGAAA